MGLGRMLVACLALFAVPLPGQQERRAVTTPFPRLDDGALSAVEFVELGPGGTMLVGQPQDGRVLLLGADGGTLRTFGRRGSGPGEFRSPVSGGFLAGDSVWVFDRMQHRMSVFLRQGRHVMDVQIPMAIGPAATLAWWRDVELAWTGYRKDGVAGQGLISRPRTTAGVPLPAVPATFRVLHVIPKGGCMTPLGAAGRTLGIPYCALPKWNMSMASGIAVLVDPAGTDFAGTGRFRLSLVGPRGDTVSSRVLAPTPVPLPPKVFERAMDDLLRAAGGAFATGQRPAPPRYYPPAMWVVVEPDGAVWLGQRLVESTRWLHVPKDGAPDAVFTLPGLSHLVAADRGTLVAVLGREDGDERLVRVTLRL